MSTPNPFMNTPSNPVPTPITESAPTPVDTGFDPFGSLMDTKTEEIKSAENEGLRPSQLQLLDLHPAAFDQLTKILVLLQDQGVISINNSVICQAITRGGTSILKCDISQISADLQLHISNPKKYVGIFKHVKSNSNIKVIDDDEQKRYLVVIEGPGGLTCHLPKQLDSVIEDSTPPDLSNAEPLGDEAHRVIKISKEIRDTIKLVMSRSGEEYVDILIKDNNPLAIYFPGTAVMKFPEVTEDIDDTNADLILRSYSFLIIDSDEYYVYIGKLNDDYWMVTNSKIGIIDVFLMENIQAVSNDNMLI
jgi:hypothetical protein